MDILERKAQLDEDGETATARLGRYMTRVHRAWEDESRDKTSKLNKELHAVRALGTDYDRFILDVYDVYTTLRKTSSEGLVWGWSRRAKETRQFIARAQSMSEDEFREEIRKEQEEAQEARKRAQEARFKNTRWYKQYEQRKLQEEQHQSTQDSAPQPQKGNALFEK